MDFLLIGLLSVLSLYLAFGILLTGGFPELSAFTGMRALGRRTPGTATSAASSSCSALGLPYTAEDFRPPLHLKNNSTVPTLFGSAMDTAGENGVRQKPAGFDE